MAGAKDLGLFVAMLKTTPADRPGAGQGQLRSPGRINHILAAVRELYKHAVADGTLQASVLACLYEVGDDRYLPAANRDPKMFRTPNGIDLAQGHDPHLGFGSANHRCLGSHLARRELKVVFEEFHRRIPEYCLEPGVEPVQIWPSLLLRLNAVPLVFAPGGGA